MTRPLGKRQVETLLGFYGLEGFKGWIVPDRGLRPWSTIRPLIKRGLMYAKRERLWYWSIEDDDWRPELGRTDMVMAGLTPEGMEVATLEQQRREAA